MRLINSMVGKGVINEGAVGKHGGEKLVETETVRILLPSGIN